MSDVRRLTELPVPKWKVGDVVFGYNVVDGQTHVGCPDCLGGGKWAVKSPAGFESTVECPRCHGQGKLATHCYVGHTECLTVGSIRTSTVASHWDEHVEYMCNETGVGSGRIWRESFLCATAEDAQRRADAEAAETNRRREETPEGKERKYVSHLNRFQMHTADQKQAERQLWEVQYDFRALVERVADLKPDQFVYSEDDEGAMRSGHLNLDPDLLEVLKNYICNGYGGRGKRLLATIREERENECKC